ncbi:MAG: carboxypeptidase-like regulatory domain-containing protein [Bacteroidales bacterium]
MEKVQISKLNSYVAVQRLIERERAAFSSLLDFTPREAAFNEAVAAISGVTSQQQYANVAEMLKFKSEKALIAEKMALLAKKLVIHADKTQNDALIADVNYSERELLRMKSATLIDVAKMMHERGTKVLTSNEAVLVLDDLTPIATSLTVLETLRAAYRSYQMKMKQDTRTIQAAFAKADVTLSKLSLSVALLMHSDPALYSRYLDACKLITAMRPRSVSGAVAEAKTEYPLSGVKMAIRRIDDPVTPDLMITPPEISKKSAEKGGFYIRNLSEGNYLLTASKMGYKTNNMPFTVAAGETTKLTLYMEVAS